MTEDQNQELITLDELAEKLEKVIKRVTQLESNIKRVAGTIDVMDNRMKRLGVIKDINYSG
jgi:hypothetical protein